MTPTSSPTSADNLGKRRRTGRHRDDRQPTSQRRRPATVSAELAALVATGIVTREERIALFHGFDRVGEIMAAEARARRAA